MNKFLALLLILPMLGLFAPTALSADVDPIDALNALETKLDTMGPTVDDIDSNVDNMAVYVETISGNVSDLDSSVDDLISAAEALETKLDALGDVDTDLQSVLGNQQRQFVLTLSSQILNKECTPLLWLPAPYGLFEEVEKFVSDSIYLAELSLDPDVDLAKAQEEFDKALALKDASRYAEACKKLGMALAKVSKQ